MSQGRRLDRGCALYYRLSDAWDFELFYTAFFISFGGRTNNVRSDTAAWSLHVPGGAWCRVSFSGHRARHILDGALEDEDDLVRTV